MRISLTSKVLLNMKKDKDKKMRVFKYRSENKKKYICKKDVLRLRKDIKGICNAINVISTMKIFFKSTCFVNFLSFEKELKIIFQTVSNYVFIFQLK